MPSCSPICGYAGDVRTFVIVGAGFGGTMVAVHLLGLLAASPTPARVCLVERSGRFTAGVAYATHSLAHVLNVPAGRMSALPDDPDHFLRWARNHDPRIGGGSFVARALYGRYLAWLLEQADRDAPDHVHLLRIPRGVLALRSEDDGVDVELDGGGRLHADHVVLAIGNFPPGDPPLGDPAFVRSWRYARDPWAVGALEAEPRGDVLLVGTGLTMLDVAIALEERGHLGRIHAISRRGLLPQAHRVSMLPPVPHARPTDLDAWPRTARGLLHAVRREVARAAGHGADWREVITSLRHDTPALWQSLPTIERERFLRHVRPFWETHRHRAAPETANAIAELLAVGKLAVHTGRVVAVHEDAAGVDVTLGLRGGPARLRVARVINCTGPQTDLRRIDDPLVRALLDAGQVRPDALGLGLDTDAEAAVIAADGHAQPRLSLVGPLRKGRLWENTAVPELRGEAKALAQRLALNQQ